MTLEDVVKDAPRARLNGLSIEHKRADYVAGLSRLFLAAIFDLPGWIPLGLIHTNMPGFQSFCQNAEK